MERFGILVDYEWCSGCLSCVVACQMENDLPAGRSGVTINEIGPWKIEGQRWQHDFQPAFTSECNLCAARRAKGKLPSCVQHCQAAVLDFGKVEDLVPKLSGKGRQSLIVPC
ncbi:MAG: hypothetical protein LBG81_07550 [Coriobacteriaceae bacterium]|jgi:anaerobic dimethyl sulfoxide reductase subunit B (iron-sulfur subunit)|nr:hypothetical protein [Coriobacteriaceae bacterium]